MQIKPLNIPSKLLDAPKTRPKFGIKFKDDEGGDVVLPDPRAVRSLLALMCQSAVNGGAACHWGGPSAMTETWVALHGLMFRHKKWFEKFHFVNDIGHAENGIYALRTLWGYGDLTLEALKGFRSLDSKLTGHGEAHLYPEGVLLSNGPLGSAFPGAQGLSLADKLLGNDRVTVVSLSDGASMEGEAKEAFSAIPGLSEKGKLNPFVLLLSDNNTKLGGRIDRDSFSMNPTFKALEVLGWEVIEAGDGHNLEKMYLTLKNAVKLAQKNPHKPVCVWIKTIKGYGVKSTSDSSSGGHGFPLKAHDPGIHAFVQELWGEDKVPAEFKRWGDELIVKPAPKVSDIPSEKTPSPKDKIQKGISLALTKACREGLPVFSISSDLQGSTGVKAFQSEFPDHFVDVGVAEANMISTAVGMSKAGFIPVVDTFAAFGVTKGNLPLIMGSLSEAPVIAVFSHTGFQDAADGASHQSLTYLSALSSIPHLNVVNLSCSEEAEAYVYQAIKKIAEDRERGESGESYVFFLGRENFPLSYAKELQTEINYELHRSYKLFSGHEGAIVVTGSLVPEAIRAREELKAQGCMVSVIVHPFVNHTDFAEIGEWVAQSGGKLVTVEDHQVIAGMGAQLVHELKLLGVDFKVASLGVRGSFGQSAYEARQLYAKHGLDASGIVSAMEELQKKGSFMNLDTEVLRLKWKEVSHEVRHKWDSISEKELEKVKGNMFAMVSLVQEKFGISREDAVKKVEELLSKYNTEELKSLVGEKALKAIGKASTIFHEVKSRIKK